MPPGAIYRAGQAIVPGWRGYRRRGKKEGKKAKEEREEGKEEREEGKEEKEEGKEEEKREKKWKLKEGNHRACAKEGPEHPTVTCPTVCLGAHYSSDYGALGSIFMWLRCAWEHITVTTLCLPPPPFTF